VPITRWAARDEREAGGRGTKVPDLELSGEIEITSAPTRFHRAGRGRAHDIAGAGCTV